MTQKKAAENFDFNIDVKPNFRQLQHWILLPISTNTQVNLAIGYVKQL